MAKQQHQPQARQEASHLDKDGRLVDDTTMVSSTRVYRTTPDRLYQPGEQFLARKGEKPARAWKLPSGESLTKAKETGPRTMSEATSRQAIPAHDR